MAKIESGKMEINENYGRIGAIRQSLFEIFEDEAKKKNLALHYTINVEHEHILTDTTKNKRNICQHSWQCHKNIRPPVVLLW